MASLNIRGIPVEFPFQPYDIQKAYMERVIQCLQEEKVAVLESPTGTGKTLSLLCASLAWLQLKKAQIQASSKQMSKEFDEEYFGKSLVKLGKDKNPGGEDSQGNLPWTTPTIIYASRTHTQLAQCIQELRRTSYKHMKAIVLGSREQLCIHPDVVKATDNYVKVNMCRAMVQTRSCYLHNRVEKKKLDPIVNEPSIIDIEDMVKFGEKHKFCPYYMAKEVGATADIIFLPYNYLLDPKARKMLGIEMKNSIVILDEAHNIERLCEEAASAQLKTTDIALCIEEVTALMRMMSDESFSYQAQDSLKDFTPDELIILKEYFLKLEQAFDEVKVAPGNEGTVYDGSYIFETLGKASISTGNVNAILGLIDKITQFLAAFESSSPFARKGAGLQAIDDFLRIVFLSTDSEEIKKCYKLHVSLDEPKKNKPVSSWFSKATEPASRGCKTFSYWCFSPKFGMKLLLTHRGIHSVILTSGTLSPMKPLLSELGIQTDIVLENPHIVSKNQICVKILSKGPDAEPLNSSYQNRNNPKYVSSLGYSIMNLSRMIPDGLLIFFPSYPLMNQCVEAWQSNGTWAGVCKIKPIFVEPKNKEAFSTAMSDYYSKIRDPQLKGAIFMAVCRGKVSEGLDFADVNGRAVIVTGLPFPPMMDPKVKLKMKYLDICNAKDKQFLTGNEWYSLEASRAVNQAVGRVIRHRNDYGAILLLDGRFNQPKMRNNLSLWLRDHVQHLDQFGMVIAAMRDFFRHAKLHFSEDSDKQRLKEKTERPIPSSSSLLPPEESAQPKKPLNPAKKLKMTIVSPNHDDKVPELTAADIKAYINLVRKTLDAGSFQKFIDAVSLYRNEADFDQFSNSLTSIFLTKPAQRYVLQGLYPFIKEDHKERFCLYADKMKV